MKEQTRLALLKRTAFTTDRTLEFLTESELRTQIGYGCELWPLVIAKELIDNALDACESVAGGAPEITIKLEADALAISDNGPGLPAEIIERSLDYHVRVSDKKHYIAPTRGQLGNALKCVWAVPFVVDGSRGLVEVEAWGMHHRIEVSLDRIAQKPRIDCTREASPAVKNGTLVKIHWDGIASLKSWSWGEFYRSRSFGDALPQLIADFAAFNPHANFTLRLPENEVSFPAADPGWRKWRADDPTSPHWYRTEDLRDLIAAYLTNENGGPAKSIRDFVGEFAGLSGTQYRKRVLEEAGVAAGTCLRDLVVNGDLTLHKIAALLDAMKKHSRQIKPAALGAIGEHHIRAAFGKWRVAPDSFKYKKVAGLGDDGLPFVVEVAFGVREEDDGEDRRLIMGLNWSPVFKVPTQAISSVLAQYRIDRNDPVVVFVHQAEPRLAFTDHGKGSVE
jgi:DNA topoisomerase VI subunit B